MWKWYTLVLLLTFAMDNPNPKIFTKTSQRPRDSCFNDNVSEEVDALEVFDLIKSINDPEHPVTLEQLNVVRPEHIYVSKSKSMYMNTYQNNQREERVVHDVSYLTTLLVHFTPTIPHCSMATLIGLSIQLKLIRSLPASHFRILVQIRPGTHNSEDAINRQLADKERVAAAGENVNLRRVVAACLMGPPRSGIAL